MGLSVAADCLACVNPARSFFPEHYLNSFPLYAVSFVAAGVLLPSTFQLEDESVGPKHTSLCFHVVSQTLVIHYELTVQRIWLVVHS